MECVCKVTIKENIEIDKTELEEQIGLAIITAECFFGKAKVRFYAGYLLAGKTIVVDISSEVGTYIAQVLIGLLTRLIGEESFLVEKISEKVKNI